MPFLRRYVKGTHTRHVGQPHSTMTPQGTDVFAGMSHHQRVHALVKTQWRGATLKIEARNKEIHLSCDQELSETRSIAIMTQKLQGTKLGKVANIIQASFKAVYAT
eukprot:6480254-Amphidinium_carterae.1